MAGPVGNILSEEASGGGTSSDTFTDSGAAFLTTIPNGGAGTAPTKDTFIAVDPYTSAAQDYIRKVETVDSNTQLTVTSAFAGSLSNKAYITYEPQAAITLSPGHEGSGTASGSVFTGGTPATVGTSSSGVSGSGCEC